MSQKRTTRLVAPLLNNAHSITAIFASLVVLGLVVGAGTGGAVAAAGSNPSPASGPAQISANQPAAQNASSSPLIISTSIVVSGETPGPNEGGCSQQNRFYRGQRVVWRMKIIDPQTGQQMDNTSLQGVTVNVPMSNGTTKSLDGTWGKHGPDHFWTAAWTVPSSYPAGQVNYSVSVTNHQAKKINFAVPPSQLQVVDKSLKQVKQAANASSGSGGSQARNASSQGSPSAPSQGSLPWVFWLIVVVVAIVVIGLVWNGSRQG